MPVDHLVLKMNLQKDQYLHNFYLKRITHRFNCYTIIRPTVLVCLVLYVEFCITQLYGNKICLSFVD